MSARLRDGWVEVDCDAPDLATVHISVGTAGDWRPAFRDWSEGLRVAKIRPPGPGRADVYLRVDADVTRVGRLTLP